MKSFNIMLAAFLAVNVMFGQENDSQQSTSVYGESFVPSKVRTAKEMLSEFKNIAPGDSIQTVFSAKTTKVCQAKGCWMTLQLDDENEVLVKFKDYGFFVPTDWDKQEVTVKGKAFIDEISVEEQRHYAEDAGKSASEIAKITTPKRTLRFQASGVLIDE
ncbi:MAG: DUF4920 domain-containing protein [Allomuricauda sp.]|nr:MAG: DUF4920 domain-containing protein [Allomuricauda sp.]